MSKRCKDCEYYPYNCGYWDMSKRKKNAGYLGKEIKHNCPDFNKRR